jgi:hypothetical protein
MSSADGKECILCRGAFPTGELAAHLTSFHDNVSAMSVVDPEGNIYSLADLEVLCRDSVLETDTSAQLRPIRPSDKSFAFSLNPESMRRATTRNTGSGGVLSDAEMTIIFNQAATNLPKDYKLDRDQFTVDIMHHCIVNDGSPKGCSEGTVTLVGVPTSAGIGGVAIHVAVSWGDLMTTISGKFRENSRDAVWRRIYRYWAPAIFLMMNTSPVFKEFNDRGTSRSQRFGVPHKLWYAATSVFPAMKDPGTWTEDERKIHRMVTANSGGEFGGVDPHNTRPVEVDSSGVPDSSLARSQQELRELLDTGRIRREWQKYPNEAALRAGVGFKSV